MRKASLLVILALTFPALAQADSKVVGHMRPLPSELLAEPIKLTNHCKYAEIVEWRATNGRTDTTAKSKKAISIIDVACNKAISQIRIFAKSQGLTINDEPFRVKISLMPADIHVQGRNYRNLNDNRYRFKSRNTPGQAFWGWADEKGDLYIRNDVFKYTSEQNRNFEIVFVHELWHIASFQYGIYDTLSDNEIEKNKQDEILAIRFTTFLGY